MKLIATQHHIIYIKESVKLGRLGRRQMDSRDFLTWCNESTYPVQQVLDWSGSGPSAVNAEEFGLLLLASVADRRQCQLGSLHLLFKHEEKGLQLATKLPSQLFLRGRERKRILFFSPHFVLIHVFLNLPLFCCPPLILLLFEAESMLDEMDAKVADDDVVVGDFCSIFMMAGAPE